MLLSRNSKRNKIYHLRNIAINQINRNINCFETPRETANAVAELIALEASEKQKNSTWFNIALSGGSTPKMLFEILADQYKNRIPWEIVRFFWVDERCVVPTHAESNYRMTFESLFSRIAVPTANVFRMKGENDPATEATRYAELLTHELELVNGYPHFDLVLLGMGDDGHTASIFPENIKLLDAPAIVEVSTHPVRGQKRVTLTGEIIHNAAKIVFLITGETKALILKQIIHNEEPALKYPASYICNKKANVYFYVDKAAALQI